MRCSLPLTRPQGRFQFLPKPVVFLLKPFYLKLLFFDLLLGPLQFRLGNKLNDIRLPSTLLLASGCFHPPYCSRNGELCPAKSFRTLSSRAFQDGK